MHPVHPNVKQLLCSMLFGLMLLYTQVCSAQDPVKPKQDSVTAQQDTTKQKFDERILDNLRRMSERKTIMGKLLDAILEFDRKEQEVYGLDVELIQREYEKHNYKIVRRLDIVTLDAFGYSINDSTRVPRNFFEKAGNAIHIKTSRGLVRNQLLFRRNEPLEPLALIESERLLRQTDYLLDARIVVNEITTTDDSVDVYVVTKDVFSMGGSGSFTPSSGRGRISLRELNFLGRGHQVRGTYRFNMNRPRPWEASGAYSIPNISRTYIGADLVYTDENYYKEKSAYLHRDFFATNTKYAGAVGYADIEEQILLPFAPGDSIARFGDLKYNRKDVWLGRAFKFKTYHLGYEPRGRLIVGLRMIDTDYSKIPTDNFQSNVLMLGSIGYSVRKYYKDRYLFGFGRTEDIPAGTLVSFTSGYEKGNVTERRYFAASTSYARYRTQTGYFYGSATWGSFIRDDRWEQGVLELESLYFTGLKEWGNWKLRHYIQGRATFGINRNPEELLAINNESGLRGFRSDLLRGSRRVTFNYEANLYTPFSLLGFRLAAVMFADVAWLSTGNKSSPFKNTPYRGYGIGFRFRNEYLSFSTIQLLLSYYPKLPPNENFDSFRILESSRPYYDFTDFRFTRPGVANFR
ncbi:BamA/TamA family outer membrane protein [Pontibacter cellulosilyticus]|uniref:Outer membrane protein assembly factor BamA n=1 Tax=Pontibacter cellulosilyticus TaxID=1720253 RepID=A0A923SJ92_9BACT|nr:hypothetical protein [Pontibacter cellulosilyticus]MBC5993654.1 hypothetical protein [Pontibacter cellulosilyticus]